MSILKNIWKSSSKHKKLYDEQSLQNAEDCEGSVEYQETDDLITFKLKYLGSTVVENAVGLNVNVKAVKNIIKTAKASRTKIRRVNVEVSLKGIAVVDLQGNDLFKASIYSISNCSTDAVHRQVFSFFSLNTNEIMECHAFLCNSRKVAETVTLAVAHSFGKAYEAWSVFPSTSKLKAAHDYTCDIKTSHTYLLNNNRSNGNESTTEEKLIDFDVNLENISCNFPGKCYSQWVRCDT